MAIKTAVIGCGRTANDLHAPVLEKHPEFEVTVICDVNTEALDKYSKRFPKAQKCTDYHSILDSDAYDFAIILTYSYTHTAIALDFLRAGKNVLITKPWATTVADADDIIRTAKENNCIVMPFVPCHDGADVVKLKELIAAGTIGDLFRVYRAQMTFGKRSDWQTLKAYAGGYLNNWGPHIVEQAMCLVGEPIKSVYAQKRQIINPGDADDMFCSTMVTESGVIVQVDHNIISDYLPNWVVQGSKGTIYVKGNEMEIHEISYPAAEDKNVYRSATETKKTKITLEGKIFGDHYSIYTMIANTLKGGEYVVSLDYARHLTEIMQSIHESADNNTLVTL
ncbi:MAG: Gfo/Idh/MocA family oxidoreductase [Clostridia bacterium]|nr:Gfo/Idh/MocA family oxidoreductase [Clostridia bacterium]